MKPKFRCCNRMSLIPVIWERPTNLYGMRNSVPIANLLAWSCRNCHRGHYSEGYDMLRQYANVDRIIKKYKITRNNRVVVEYEDAFGISNMERA